MSADYCVIPKDIKIYGRKQTFQESIVKHQISFLVFALFLSVSASAADQPQWGEYGTRNMVSGETGLPDSFDAGSRDSQTGLVDITTTKNVRWTAPVGEIVYGTPIVAEGKVFVGVTNSTRQEIPQLQGDRGVLVCLDE
ncbi:MAG: PQQ-binding-like beta-propeller repeat protein, partial [Planctomycetaceae bacterium]|nr:PQQ-binding-like beta-propeller repeat protein [Planctomycetaceae bacterium]